jgi:hypothetical protein
VRAHQKESTKGKNVIASDEYRAKIVELESPEINLWKKNSMFEVQAGINEGRLIFANHMKTGGHGIGKKIPCKSE